MGPIKGGKEILELRTKQTDNYLFSQVHPINKRESLLLGIVTNSKVLFALNFFIIFPICNGYLLLARRSSYLLLRISPFYLFGILNHLPQNAHVVLLILQESLLFFILRNYPNTQYFFIKNTCIV